MTWLTNLYEPHGADGEYSYAGNGSYQWGRRNTMAGGPAPTAPAAPTSLMDRFQAGQDEANAANEKRYKEALGVRYRSRDYVRSLYDKMGKSEIDDATAASNSRLAGGQQSLINRGLFNTTALDSFQRTEGSNLTRQKNSIWDSLTRAKADSDAQLTGNIADTMERRQDLGPNAQLYGDAMNAEAQAHAARKKRSSDLFGNVLGAGIRLAPLLF